jgi:hypothetical protein
MTAPSNYFYDGQIRRFISQFISMVSNFYVQFGTDSSGGITYRRIPVMYGDPSRQVAQIVKQNSENITNAVPAMAVYIDSLNYDQTRLQNPTNVQSMMIRQREFDPVTGTYGENQGQTYSVERLMPVPYKMSLKLDIWTSNTEQKLQIIEQISQLFNPAMEVQSTDNYVDWGSLSYALLTDVNWSGRSVPTMGEEPIDVATLKFDLPIWISTNAKVKKMGVIQTVVNSFEDLGNLEALAIQQQITFGAYGILATTSPTRIVLKLLEKSALVDTNFDGGDVIITAPLAWPTVLDLYGNFVNGISEIRLLQPTGSEIIGTIALNPTDNSELIYNPLPSTLPANTLPPVTAIIDPQHVNVGSYLTNPAIGTSYLLTHAIGAFINPEGALAWRGLDGQDLVANSNDIVTFNGSHWTVTFDSEHTDVLNYVTNLTTEIQYRWLNQQWQKSYDGIYQAGEWSLVV